MKEDGEIKMLDEIYNLRQEKIENEVNFDRENLLEKLNNASLEELESVINSHIAQEEDKNIIIEKLDMLIENYEIKMGYYMEKYYKQGFKDGVNLYLECNDLKK